MKKWHPLEPAVLNLDEPEPEIIARTMQTYKLSEAEAIEFIRKELSSKSYWINDLYQVQVEPATEDGTFVRINIRRRDGEAVLRDWRHFQLIKNQIVGKECEAVELYPAESRLVDTSNKYTLFASTDPSFRWPFGWNTRDVGYEHSKVPGLKQRPFEKALKQK